MMEGLCFYSSKYRVTKGFKFHAQPQTGAYSCWLYSKTRGGHSHDVSKMEPEILTRGQIGAIFYIYSISTILYCFLVIYLCYFHSSGVFYTIKMAYNAKLIVRGSSGAKIYIVFNMQILAPKLPQRH